MKRDLVIAFMIGLLAQAIWVLLLPQPSYMDAYYYTTNGRRLAQGDGFTEEVIWQYLDEPEGLPTPSHSYWMPFTSLLAAMGYLLGESFRWAQLPFWLLAGILPVLSYLICYYLLVSSYLTPSDQVKEKALDGLQTVPNVGSVGHQPQWTENKWQLWTAVCLTASFGLYARLVGQPSTFAPFGVMGATCLLALGLGLNSIMPNEQSTGLRRYGWWFLAGMMAGLAHLTRADGVLLLLIGGWVWVLLVRRWPLLVALVGGYLLTFGWWMVRSMQVWERPLSVAGTQTIFLTTYDDLFAYERRFDLSSYLAWGWGNILESKAEAVWLAVQNLVVVNGAVFMAPFILLAWWRLRERVFLRPFAWYTLALYVAMSLVFTFPGARGGLLHSSIAIWPFMMALAALGLGWAVDWVATKLTHWQPAKSKPIFATLFVVVSFAISLIVGLGRLDGLEEGETYHQIGQQIPEDAVVMTADAPAFYYHTGRPSLSLPNEPPEQLLQVAEEFGATHIVLDMNHPRPLHPLYQQTFTDERFILEGVYPLVGADGLEYDQIQLYALEIKP